MIAPTFPEPLSSLTIVSTPHRSGHFHERHEAPPYPRTHSDEFKQSLIEAWGELGASVAGGALGSGINANQLRRWMRDGRTTCTEGCKVSQRERKRIEEIFGWMNMVLTIFLPRSPSSRRSPNRARPASSSTARSRPLTAAAA